MDSPHLLSEDSEPRVSWHGPRGVEELTARAQQLPAQTARLCSTVGGMSMERECKGRGVFVATMSESSLVISWWLLFFSAPALFFSPSPFVKEEDLKKKKTWKFFFSPPLPPLPLPLMWPLV